MIKIELQFETGAEARQALQELLGTSLTATVSAEDLQFALRHEKIAENFEAPKMEVLKEEKPAEENVTKKRRTKADIEVEKNAPAFNDVVGEGTRNGDVQDDSVAKTPAVTKEMLQEKAVNLIRNSKKDAVVAVLKKFGADSIAQADKNPLKVEDYSAVMDELNKL